MIPPLPVLPLQILPTSRAIPPSYEAAPSILTKASFHLQNEFDNLMQRDRLFAEHISCMRNVGLQAVVFGGWARDKVFEFLYSVENPSNDIDMVAFGDNSVVEILGHDAIPTVFGGCGRMEATIHFDAWDLPNTFLIKRNRLEMKFETLPFTADYTLNSLIFRPAQFFGKPSIFDAGAFFAINARIVDFRANEVILPIVQASRAANLAARLDCEFSPTVREFLIGVCGEKGVLNEVLSGLDRYCAPSLLADAKFRLISALHRS